MGARIKNSNQNNPQSKLYKAITSIAIFGTFVAVGLFILGMFEIINFNTFIFGAIATIALISIGCLLVLPWVRNFERGEYKKISIVFMVLVIICTILWIVCVYLGIHLYKNAQLDNWNKSSLLLTLRFIKITSIISLQILLSSLIAGTIIRYKKDMIFFQVITYASNLFFDFYVTCFLLCLKIDPAKGLEISKSIQFLFSKTMFVIFLLSIVYMSISSKIMKTVDSRRLKNAVEVYNNPPIKPSGETTQPIDPVEERLQKLQTMLEKKLISQDEYNKKREEILKDL